MKRYTLILAALLYSCPGHGQEINDSETADVYSCLITDKREVYLRPQMGEHILNEVYQHLAKRQFFKRVTIDGVLHADTLALTKQERRFILEAVKAQATKRWTKERMEAKGLSRFQLIDSSATVRWPESDYIVYEVMEPVFIRNYTVCFAYYDYACGGLCGFGELSIWVKKEGKWVRWQDVFVINS